MTRCLEHRTLLDHAPGFRPFRGTDLFERITGQPTVDRLVDLLYEGIGDDERLRPLFPRDLAGGRSMSKLFFAEWLRGSGHYSERPPWRAAPRPSGCCWSAASERTVLSTFR